MVRKLLIAGFLVVVFVGLKRDVASLFFSTEYHFTQDQLISDACFSSIKNSALSLLSKGYSAQQIIDHLKKEFFVLSKITIRYKPFATSFIFHSKEPTCFINNSLVFTSTHEFFSENIFSKKAIEHIPHITISHDVIESPSLVSQLLEKVPKHFYEAYNLELVDEHTIRFSNKDQPKFTIVTSIEQENLSHLFVQCELVKKNIDERKMFNKNVKWVADARFAHYIVAYRE